MGSYRISSFIISLILVSLFVGVLGVWMADLNATYGGTYDNDTIEVYNQLSALQNRTQNLEEQTTIIKEQKGVIDIIGSLFSNAYQVLLVTKDSYETFDTIKDQAVQDANLGQTAKYFNVAIGLIVLVIIVVGIIISVLVKKDV
jgi:hypothetical protein